ncbi:hypothetical protein EMIHUDRAFT_254868 [Emiliania huxleyi CCMP1516]|uniref:Uncharacterized protein n=2 Tax=Emiliania huxleyi TaxID=2903 RepID=A0A0D3JK00_EMIH1|nr:hypothetical protein EMIHUDRAFT_254868 [Emiliania huxleyi CCMP1516]EOD23835.1 hypothetical protein EMIHUDRAFT_254868 [Emiliania huxleyi CCMP1516]|eukprot:XP_005776264.1 hypothetical protein EMIHUDRAFT_254868 [Emiliania huxleyi CCMP1516]
MFMVSSQRYCDVHRNLLQLMLHHGFMSEAEMLAQCRACVEAHAQDAKANKGPREHNPLSLFSQ